MKQVLIQGGKAVVTTVPTPVVGQKNVLVRVEYSCISVGTEMAGVKMSGLPLYRRAMKQPENVGRVLDMVREQGIKRTLDRVSGKLAAGSPTGYSASGVVVQLGAEVEGFSVGDRVACAGAGIANHAEFIDVPVNLTVRMPDQLSSDLGATVTLGAIAMQGVRRAQPTLGETIVVVGLGILGQITVQLLTASGCRVIGVDLDPKRIELALGNGMDVGLNPESDNYLDKVIHLTDGMGADCVIVTAATESHQVISEAMGACRKKGRLVLVGDVGLNLNRSDFYKKELDFLISSSYGPGRYDPVYEEGGQDYPLPYVRWTENRNMQAYLEALAKGQVKLKGLSERTYTIDQAADAYAALGAGGEKPLLVLLNYPGRPELAVRKVEMNPAPAKSSRIRVAIAGASSFVQGVHLPNLVALRDRFELRAIMSRTGANARAVATQYSASYCTTDFNEILKDDEVDLVMITTRHDLHGSMAISALRAGKHVFVEKPLTLAESDLREIEEIYTENLSGPLLMVGFNRRFSPGIAHLCATLKRCASPLVVNYRMNAGFISEDHWVQGFEGGGRNLGEACHIYDLFNYLTGSSDVVSIQACAISPSQKQWRRNDNFVATVKYSDGSICTLTYTALGAKSYPKERMEIFCDGNVLVLDDYKSAEVFGVKGKPWTAASPQKGQKQELEALARSLSQSEPWPISLRDQIKATEIAFEVERQIRQPASLTSQPELS